MSISRHRFCLTFIIILGLNYSCTLKKNIDDIITIRVERKDYLDVVTVSGILEAVTTHSYDCPGIFSDVTIQYLIPEGTHVKIGDTLCLLEARELENQYIQSLHQLEQAEAEYNKSAANLELQYLLLEAQVKNIEASTEITRLDSTQMQFTSPLSREIIRLELLKADIEKEIILKKLEFLKRINDSELQTMKLKVVQQKNQVDRAKDQLDKLTLTADVEGIVLYAYSWQSASKIREGDVVWAVMPIIQIPDLREMQVRLLVCEADYKRLALDQELNISVDAFPGIILTGKIKYKAPVGKPVKRDSEVKVFDVTVSLDSSSIDLQPGLGVTCEVMVSRIQDTIVVPLVSLFDEDSIRLVYVSADEGFIKKEVKVSEYNNKEAIITGGLRVNEVIALMKPSESLILDTPDQ
jgi:multidrug efflux pump subunit AcrA (membrane-fusion protein)